MIKMMLGANPEVQRMMDMFANEEYFGVGWGHTSIEIDGGSRASSFGPRAFSGPAMYAGVIAAVAVPNFLNAVDRGKQKRSMADLRSIGTAIESYSIDNRHYPIAQSIGELKSQIEPLYIRTAPAVDGWENPIQVESTPTRYRVRSLGKDGLPDQCGGGATELFTADICFEDGQFTQYPDGVQR